MNGFQVAAWGVLCLLLVRDLTGWSRPAGGSVVRLLRCTVWVAAAAAIRRPDWVQELASALGIGRGADVILYLSVLGFLWVSFYLYSCHLRLQRELTTLVRQIAIRDAAKGPPPPV